MHRVFLRSDRCAIGLFLCLLIAANASASIVDNTGAGFAIPDNNTTATTSTITLGVDETISNIEVSIFGLSHTWVGDLIARLQSPDGTTADLFVRVGAGTFGDGSDLNGDYTFADGGLDFGAAVGAVGTNVTVPGGTYGAATDGEIPISLVTEFGGQSTLGDWTLSISDNAQFDTGSFTGWGLNITSNITAVPEPGSLMLVVLSGAVLLKRRRRKRS
ncbi:MAG: proprotein convertase P-domain-containing protein [Planctomycetales bacterium]|nr:proprotein convertase P-domain-containing protein [Planctomycetales bacterium]